MKTIASLICAFLWVQVAWAQDLQVPELSSEQKQEVLYSHVFAYCISGIAFAKAEGKTPEEYGRFMGKAFSAFWDPETDLKAMAGRMIYILAGLHPDNDMEILLQNESEVRIRLKNVDLSFKSGPMFGVSYQEFLECSEGLILELAGSMGMKFKHKVEGEWYVASFLAGN